MPPSVWSLKLRGADPACFGASYARAGRTCRMACRTHTEPQLGDGVGWQRTALRQLALWLLRQPRGMCLDQWRVRVVRFGMVHVLKGRKRAHRASPLCQRRHAAAHGPEVDRRPRAQELMSALRSQALRKRNSGSGRAPRRNLRTLRCTSTSSRLLNCERPLRRSTLRTSQPVVEIARVATHLPRPD